MPATSSCPARAAETRLSASTAFAPQRAVFPVFRREDSAPPPLPPTEEEIRAQARADSAIQGLVEGRAEGLEQAAAEIAALKSVLENAAATLTARAEALAVEVEQALPTIITVVLRKVLNHALADDAVASALARTVAARFEAQGTPVVLRLAPATVLLLDAMTMTTATPSVRIEADATLGRGDWVVEPPDGLFDGRLDAQLDEVLRHLRDSHS